MTEICVLCERPMHRGTKPHWIIDPETLEVMGKSHKGCRDKLGSVPYAFTLEAEGPPPTPDVVEFTARMIRLREGLPEWETQVDFQKRMILGTYCFQVSSVEGLLSIEGLNKLFEWWVDGSKIITSDEAEEIRAWIREVLT